MPDSQDFLFFWGGELDKKVVISKMETTTPHGAMDDKFQIHNVDFYHLDAIIAIVYRISSAKATKFRQWATKTECSIDYDRKTSLSLLIVLAF